MDFRPWIKLYLEKKRLEEELKRVKAEMSELEEAGLEALAEMGCQNMKFELDDGRKFTVYIHRQLWASVDREEGETSKAGFNRACEALERAGLAGMVGLRFNSNVLSAWVREQVEHGIPLPAEFDGAIKIDERYSLRTISS